MLVPVAALINGARTPQCMAFLPYNKMRCSWRNWTVAFWARIGFQSIYGGNVLHQPITKTVTFNARRRVKNTRYITSTGCRPRPFVGGCARGTFTGVILACHAFYSSVQYGMPSFSCFDAARQRFLQLACHSLPR